MNPRDAIHASDQDVVPPVDTSELEAAIDKACAYIDALREERADLIGALRDVIDIIDRAGLINLSRGVQLGATSWYVKAEDHFNYARAVLARINRVQP